MRSLDQELTPQERDALIERIATGIVRRGMEVPAVLFLEMHKPLGFIASQGLVVTAPLIAPILGFDNVQMAGKLMEDRGNIERLIRRIEELAAERPSVKGG
ncbi:MAG: hypothetical protein ACP5VE_01850 [Chthonomonadales bacterium]